MTQGAIHDSQGRCSRATNAGAADADAADGSDGTDAADGHDAWVPKGRLSTLLGFS